MTIKKIKLLFDFGNPEAELKLSLEELRTSVRQTWPRVAERLDKGYSLEEFKSIVFSLRFGMTGTRTGNTPLAPENFRRESGRSCMKAPVSWICFFRGCFVRGRAW